MVRVLPAAVLAGLEGFHTSVEVIDGDGEVAWVAIGGFEAEPGLEVDTNAHQDQDLEANPRRLPCELVPGIGKVDWTRCGDGSMRSRAQLAA